MFGKKNKKLELVKEMLGTRDTYLESVKDIDLTEDEKTLLMRASSQIKKENPNSAVIAKAYAILIDKVIEEEEEDVSKTELFQDYIKEQAPIVKKSIADTSEKAFDEFNENTLNQTNAESVEVKKTLNDDQINSNNQKQKSNTKTVKPFSKSSRISYLNYIIRLPLNTITAIINNIKIFSGMVILYFLMMAFAGLLFDDKIVLGSLLLSPIFYSLLLFLSDTSIDTQAMSIDFQAIKKYLFKGIVTAVSLLFFQILSLIIIVLMIRKLDLGPEEFSDTLDFSLIIMGVILYPIGIVLAKVNYDKWALIEIRNFFKFKGYWEYALQKDYFFLSLFALLFIFILGAMLFSFTVNIIIASIFNTIFLFIASEYLKTIKQMLQYYQTEKENY